MAHPISTAAILLVGVAMAFLTMLALKGWRRSGNRRQLLLAGAFALFLVKSIVTVYAIHTNAIGHAHLEALTSVMDLGVAGLLVAPLFVKRA